MNLILFSDGVTYNKSGNNSIWALLSAIAELPPILRGSLENILFHSIWSGSSPDFNTWFQKYNTEIDILLQNGLIWNGILFKIKIHAFVADAPARSKACNSVQFNGKYGCIKCLHPTVYNSNRTIYPNLSNIDLRSNLKYNLQVLESEKLNQPFEGIKGFSYLSNWLKIPDNVLFDYMHMSLLGTFKAMINNFFDSTNSKKPFYLGNSQKII